MKKTKLLKNLSEKITNTVFDAAVLFQKSNEDAKRIKQCGIPHVVGCNSNDSNEYIDHVIQNGHDEISSDYYIKIAESIGGEKPNIID